MSKPLLSFLAGVLQRGGHAWEEQQQLRGCRGQMRDYVVLQAAAGLLTLLEMLHLDLAAVARQDVTGTLRCLRFRMVSSAMSALHALLRLPHRNMPYQLFKVLGGDAESLQQVSGWKPCLHEGLSHAVLERYPSVDALQSQECQTLLESLASIMTLDIAKLECLHAKNREHTLLRSRGWVPSLETVCSKFLLRFSNYSLVTRSKQKTESEETSSADPVRKKKKGGGAWRAFISAMCSGAMSMRQAGVQELARQYRNLSDAELLRYTIAGQAGMEAARAGEPAFGPRRRGAHVQIADSPTLPGVEDMSGAMVARDADVAVALVGGSPFAARYQQFKQELQGVARDDVLSQQEQAELQAFAWPPVEDASRGRDLLAEAPTFRQSAERRATRTAGLNAVRWHPPVAQAVSAARCDF